MFREKSRIPDAESIAERSVSKWRRNHSAQICRNDLPEWLCENMEENSYFRLQSVEIRMGGF
jgi:hypothetical protein